MVYGSNGIQCCNRPATCADPCAEGYANILGRMREDAFRDGGWDTGYDESLDRDFLVTATIQVIVPARTRVDARIIAADTLRAYITDSPYPNDPMNGLTIDDVEDLTIEEGII